MNRIESTILWIAGAMTVLGLVNVMFQGINGY